MNDYLTYPDDQLMNQVNALEGMYPDSYMRVYPYVQDVVDTLSDEDVKALTASDISHLAQEIAVHSEGTAQRNGNIITDIAQILLLRELFDRYDGRRYPPYLIPAYPYWRNENRGRGHFGRYR